LEFLDSKISIYGTHVLAPENLEFMIIFNQLKNIFLNKNPQPKAICVESHSSLLLAILQIGFCVDLPQKHDEKVENRLNHLAQQVNFYVY